MNEDTAALKQALGRFAENTIGAAMPVLADLIRPDAPISTPTPTSVEPPGRLRASITAVGEVRQSGSRYTGRVEAQAPQAVFTDRGTPAHPIFPRNPGGRLRFYWSKVGAVVVLPYVNHPGNAPMNWWQPSLDRHFPAALRQSAAAQVFS